MKGWNNSGNVDGVYKVSKVSIKVWFKIMCNWCGQEIID